MKLENATNFAVTAAGLAGAVVAAYLIGITLSWLPLRIGRRSHTISDIAVLPRGPAHATLVLVASLVKVGERRKISRFGGGGAEMTDVRRPERCRT